MSRFSWGAPIPSHDLHGERELHGEYDLGRLERAITSLVARKRDLESENLRLRAELRDRAERLRHLEEQVFELNQKRQDTIKRIDELIARLEQIDSQLEEADPSGSAVG